MVDAPQTEADHRALQAYAQERTYEPEEHVIARIDRDAADGTDGADFQQPAETRPGARHGADSNGNSDAGNNRRKEDTMAATSSHGNGGSDASVAELVRQLSEQTSRLARQEVELAKTELVAKGKRAGIGAGMFGGAGVVGLFAAGALTATAILALSTAIAAWLAALIVAVVLTVVAGALALTGAREVQQASPPIPEQATDSVKEDVRLTKTKAREARN
jgi:hypothetical protein